MKRFYHLLRKRMRYPTILRTVSLVSLVTLSFGLLLLPRPVAAQAQQPGDVVNCGPMTNFSQSPGYTSADPLLLADPAGNIHLFWVERITGKPDEPPNMPDALMYAMWNGETWSKPTDLFLSPVEYANKRVGAVRGLIDDNGYIHLTWIGPDNTFFYSHVHASLSDQATAWAAPTYISYDQSGGQYSADIAFVSPDTLHIVYGRDPKAGANQVLAHIRSTDGGQSWTEPQNIYTVPYVDRGISNVRVWTPLPGKLFTTWTEWDATGNGQVVYLASSPDNGQSWETPIRLAEREGVEYERDWVTMAPLDEDQLVVFWEGGYRAYRQAQYSQDGGSTWSEPIDTLDWLIADNGFAEFVRDGGDRLHLFVFQRVREGNMDRDHYGVESNGLWHTTWEGGKTWRQPQMIGQPNPGNFVSVAVRGGNELFAAWFSYIDLELYIMRCEFKDTPSVPLQPWGEIPPLPTQTAEGGTAVPPTPTPLPTPLPSTGSTSLGSGLSAPAPVAEGPGYSLLLGIVPTVFFIAIIVAVSLQRRRHFR
jgi:hypothetical protein